MQKYNHFSKLMSNYSYFMLNLRELSHFKHKITHFQHFASPNHHFFTGILFFLDKNDYFCTEVFQPL